MKNQNKKRLRKKTPQENKKIELSQEAKDAVEEYISGDGMWINKWLRNKPFELNDGEKQYLDSLDAATSNPLDYKGVLYRSVDASSIFQGITDMQYESLKSVLAYGSTQKFDKSITDALLLKTNAGSIIKEKGFMSTTKSEEIAAEWGGFSGSSKPIVLKIKTNENTKGIDTGKHKMEQDEVILQRGQEYEIDKIYAKDGEIYVDVKLRDAGVEQKQPVKPKLIDPKTPFKEIEPFKIEPVSVPKTYTGKEVEALLKTETERATLRERYQQEIGERNNMVDKLNSLMRRGKGKTDEYAELHKNYLEVNEKAKATKKEYTALQKKIEKDGETYFKELVAAKKTESDVAVDLSNYNPKNRNNKLDEVFDYFKKISAGYNEGTTIKVIDISGRAHYSSQYNQIHIAKSDTKFTVLHELGHSLERNNHVMKAAVDFLKRRVGNFPAEKLLYPNIKGNYERYWDGKFFNNYVGKVYKGNTYEGLHATEVISMGLEQMMRNPRLFYHQDKEHFELIYNLFFKQ